MPLMQWNTDFAVKVTQFDHDHQLLFKMVNELHDAMLAKKGREVLGGVLSQLASYTHQHFSAEERAMLRTSYPGYRQHVEEHRQLTDKVMEFMTEFEKGNALISIDLLIFLRQWLENHIKVTDRAYGAHLNAKGVS